MHAFNLPRHLYGHVHRLVLGDPAMGVEWEPAIWFGVLLEPTEAPLLTVLLECGAVYRRVPPHLWRFGTLTPSPLPTLYEDAKDWTLEQATRYNAFGREATVIEYTTLRDLRAEVIPEGWRGSYQFTLEFFGDSYSREPTQSKAMHAIELEDGRLTFQPGHHVLFHDPSFTRAARMPPTWLRRSRQTWGVDEPEE